jgi:hypothetical protein
VRAVTVLATAGLLLLGQTAGPSNDERAARAAERFRQGVENVRSVAEARRRFTEAADDFYRLHERGVRSGGLYLALGNAEALAGRWPRAIWAYHCGLRLDPNNRALRDHLAYARSLVDYPSGGRGLPERGAWPAWLHRPTAGEWLTAAAAAYTLAWFAGGWWCVRRRPLPLFLLTGFVVLAISSGAGYLVTERNAQYDRRHPLVVVGDDGTTFHRGNGPSYPLNADVPNLPAGLEARRLLRRGAWLQLQLSAGEVGWVPADRVLVVDVP